MKKYKQYRYKHKAKFSNILLCISFMANELAKNKSINDDKQLQDFKAYKTTKYLQGAVYYALNFDIS